MNLLKRFSQIKNDIIFIKKMSGATEAIKFRPLTERTETRRKDGIKCHFGKLDNRNLMFNMEYFIPQI